MTPSAPSTPNPNLQTGVEIVAEFLKTIGSDTSLDSRTVQAILSLYSSGKLTTNALLKSLELNRAGK